MYVQDAVISCLLMNSRVSWKAKTESDLSFLYKLILEFPACPSQPREKFYFLFPRIEDIVPLYAKHGQKETTFLWF